MFEMKVLKIWEESIKGNYIVEVIQQKTVHDSDNTK